MKYILKTILLLTLIHSFSYSQDGWEWQNPLPQGNNLYDVHVFKDNSAIAVGNTGTIIDLYSNAQIELVRQNVNGKYTRFNCVHFINNNIGWIGGDGYILKTIDGGKSWKETIIDSVDSTTTWRYDHIFFINDQIGWITGLYGGGWVPAIGILLKTIDGGETWKKISGCGSGSEDLYFINPDTGWAIFRFYDWELGGSASFFKTVDGGVNWEEQSGIEEYVNTLFFISDSLGWVGGQGIFRTQDGKTWETILDSISCEKIYFEDAAYGWALLENGSIIYTNDGGDIWEEQEYSGQDILGLTLHTFNINDNKYGVAVGDGGHIRSKRTESDIWEPITSTCFNGEIISIHIVDENTIWACGWDYQSDSFTPPYGHRTLVYSNDGGSTWQIINFDDQDLSKFNDIFFLNDQLGWVVGQNDFIMHTDNGGINWQYQNSGYENSYDIKLQKVFFIDSLNGWILGSGGLLTTQDGSQTWNYKQNIMPSSFVGYDIHFINKNDGWLVGHNGYDGSGEIYRTYNGGQSWQLNKKTDYDHYWSYKSIQFIDSLVGWVAGEYFQSELLYTENGGESWEIIFESPFQITDFLFQDKNHGWILLSNVYGYHYLPYLHPTLLFYTSDGGQNWEEFSIPCPNINTIGFANLNVGWVVGYNGSILKTSTGGGITFIDDKRTDLVNNPNNLKIHQNYPNPFNPSTKIKFALPKAETVKIEVYNIIGQKIKTLLNKPMPAGYHEIEFNGRNLSSGVYLYKIEAGKWSDVKKMILLH